MNRYYGRHAADDAGDPAEVALADQSHAMFRDFVGHLRDHCREGIARGYEPRDVAAQMATDIVCSDHTRETIGVLLGLALADLAALYDGRTDPVASVTRISKSARPKSRPS